MSQQAYRLHLIENIESVLPVYRVTDNRKEEIIDKPEKIERIGSLSFDNELSQELHIYENISTLEITDDDLYGEGLNRDTIDLNSLDIEYYKLLQKCKNPPSLTDAKEDNSSLSNKQYRSCTFRIAVKKVYDYKCAVCGIGIRSPQNKPEVQSAHIYPKEKKGSDDVRNGICLCRMHHWAFDVGWFTISDDYTVVVHSRLPCSEEYNFIRAYAYQKIRLPKDLSFAPDTLFLQAQRKLIGF